MRHSTSSAFANIRQAYPHCRKRLSLKDYFFYCIQVNFPLQYIQHQQIQERVILRIGLINDSFIIYISAKMMYGTPMYAPTPTYYAPPPPPAYYPPPSPTPAPQSPMIINLSNTNTSSGSPCPSCTVNTGTINRKVAGTVTFLCCIFLFFCSGGIACLYPFCSDTYKDTELVCVKCQTVKAKIPANCC